MTGNGTLLGAAVTSVAAEISRDCKVEGAGMDAGAVEGTEVATAAGTSTEEQVPGTGRGEADLVRRLSTEAATLAISVTTSSTECSHMSDRA